MPVSICLVDDHPIVRNGLKALIERLGDNKVTAEFDNGKELMDALPFKDQPDLIIMDLNMPVMDGKQAVHQLKTKKVNIPVLMLTLETEEKSIIELFRMGIRGYLPKSCTAEELKKSISDVINTGYYHNEIFATAAAKIAGMEVDDGRSLPAALTEKERQFIELVCNEDEPTYDQIASRMGVSRRTVDGYRESIFEKFNVRSKTGLVLFAIKYKIIDIPGTATHIKTA